MMFGNVSTELVSEITVGQIMESSSECSDGPFPAVGVVISSFSISSGWE